MKIHPQTIYNGSKAEFIVLPINEYKRLIAAIEDQLDIIEIQNFVQNPQETFPLEVVVALTKENSLKVYREYRGLTQAELAAKVNVSKQYISQLELGQRKGTAKVLKQVADILQIDINDLL